MKYFLDTEFIEGFHKPFLGGKRHHIDLISIGIHSEDGRSLHLISSEYNYNDADDWVKEKVIKPLYIDTVHGEHRNHLSVSNFHKEYGATSKYISTKVAMFMNCYEDSLFWRAPPGIEVYGYYADYDWVLFCSLFGRMIDLPKGFPMYCKDLKQSLDEWVNGLTNSDFFSHYHKEKQLTFEEKLKLVKEGNVKYPKQTNEHNALADAKWNYELYKFIQNNKK